MTRSEAEDHWRFVGALSLFDPTRDDVRAIIAPARRTGLKTTMVTGEALAIARETARTMGLNTGILDAANQGDLKHRERAAVAACHRECGRLRSGSAC
jgi:H+-transporting ATPase